MESIALRAQSFLELLLHSRWQWFLLASALALGPIALFRTFRFKILLGKKVSGLYSILLATRTLNFFFPARAGEIFRVFACRKESECSKKEIIVAITIESLIEIISFIAIATWAAPVLWSKLPPILGCIPLIALILVRPKWIRAVALTVLSDLTDALMVGCCLFALGVGYGPMQWCAVLVSMNLAMLIPVPGNLGTLEAGAVIALSAFGVDRSTALAFALLYRAAHLLPVVGASMLMTGPTIFRRGFSAREVTSAEIHPELSLCSVRARESHN
jgi:uncharacterized membrane protein YbhN (UPF0104 family)